MYWLKSRQDIESISNSKKLSFFMRSWMDFSWLFLEMVARRTVS